MKVLMGDVPHRNEAVTVLQPRSQLGRVACIHYGGGQMTIAGDSDGMRRLAELFALAARWKEGIVYSRSAGILPFESHYPPCDLVLCHHSLTLKPSAWKSMRGYLRPSPRSVSVPPIDSEFTIPYVRQRPYLHDLADVRIEGQTMFVVGSDPVFRTLASVATWLTRSYVDGDHYHLREMSRHEPYEPTAYDLILMWWGSWGK